jgi:fibronectin type 3 domain-containing protein
MSALYAAGAVELIWTANTEPDLGGYNVYRREEEGPWQKVNPEIQRTPLWRDATVAPGREYSYRVTVLDLAGNESAPSAEIVVETR